MCIRDRYMVEGDPEGRYAVVATTRPETIMGDTAMCINPNEMCIRDRMIGVIGKRTRQAHIGDIITCHIRESIPTASVKKGTVVKAVVAVSYTHLDVYKRQDM